MKQEYPWPPDVTDEERHEMLLRGEGDLLSDLYEFGNLAGTEGARTHATKGLSRRHLLLRRCRMWLREECGKHEGTVSPYVATDFAVHVNAFYVSLAGGLDNLAWLLLHELKLEDPVDESDRNIQRLAVLTSNEFRTRLTRARPDIAKRIAEALDWHWEIRKLRDPAAHRLPLTVVAGVMDEKEHAEALRLRERGSEALQEGNWREGMDLIFQAGTLGKFRPWLENPEGYHEGFYYLPNLVARDQAFFVDLVGSVIGTLLQELKGTGGHAHSRSFATTGDYLKRHEPYRSPWHRSGS